MTIDKQPEYPIKQVELLISSPNINHEPRYKVSVISNNKITKNYIIVSFKKPKDFIFKPGQYIWLVLPELSKQYGTIDRKAYSIASNLISNTIDILVYITNSNFLSKVKSLKSGDSVEIIGPMGSAFIVPDKGVIMIANDIGMPQFLSTLRSQAAKHVSIIICNSDGNLPFDKKELNELSKNYGYEITYIKSRPEPDDLINLIDKNEKRPIFISGPQNFVNHITTTLIDYGLNKKQMNYEENYPQIKSDIKIENIVDPFVDTKPTNNNWGVNNLDNLFTEAAKETNSHVILTDRNGQILFANQAAINLTGYTLNEMRGQTPRLWGGLMPVRTYKELWSQLGSGCAIKGTMINRRKNGSLYTVLASMLPIMHSGIAIAYLVTEDDITKMKELDKAKTEFIPIISHQLRTLLSVISWYTEMLIDGDAGKLSVKQKKYLKAIYSGNQHMVELLNSLLNVSKIELGALAIEPEETDISELANCHPLTILDTRSLPERLKLLTYNEWALAHS
jgi:PAS domain S-box-containing protein